MRARNWVLVLLVIPFVALLYPPFYAGLTPQLAGIPYFIWYQFAWTIISAAITIVVYLVQRSDADRAETRSKSAGPPVDRAAEGDSTAGRAR